MNKILISSVAAAVLATVSGAALASSAVYVNNLKVLQQAHVRLISAE